MVPYKHFHLCDVRYDRSDLIECDCTSNENWYFDYNLFELHSARDKYCDDYGNYDIFVMEYMVQILNIYFENLFAILTETVYQWVFFRHDSSFSAWLLEGYEYKLSTYIPAPTGDKLLIAMGCPLEGLRLLLCRSITLVGI